MESGIQLLEIAYGLKEFLLQAGFTVDSISSEGPDAAYNALGIEPYVAKIIYYEPKRLQLKAPWLLLNFAIFRLSNAKNFDSTRAYL